jgi:ankyrin repeat protein
MPRTPTAARLSCGLLPWVAELVALLVGRGADLESKSKLGDTALTLAAKNGHREVVALLLDTGADSEATCSLGRTPLIYAALSGHREVVALLVERAAYINAKAMVNGQTALMAAADKGDREVVAVLLDGDARLEVGDRHDWTALIHCAAGGHRQVVALLLKILLTHRVLTLKICLTHRVVTLGEGRRHRGKDGVWMDGAHACLRWEPPGRGGATAGEGRRPERVRQQAGPHGGALGQGAAAGKAEGRDPDASDHDAED